MHTRLKQIREILGITQKDWALSLDIGEVVSISRWENGVRQPGYVILSKLADKYKINLHWLLTGEGEMFVTSNSKTLPDNHEDPAFNYIPLYNVELAAGHGTLVESERVTSRYAFRKEWVRKISSSPRSLALCLVRGDSMNPTLRDGDIVMIDTSRKTPNLNGIYSINLGGLAAVKRLELGLRDKIRIISDNVAEYPTYEADLSDIIIIGQVVWYARELVKTTNGNGGL